MQKNTVISAIRQVLHNELQCQYLDRFHAQARLNEDLYLDSVLLMQLLLHLELSLGIAVPDSALNKQDLATVDSLAQFLLSQSAPAQAADAAAIEPAPEFDDIKVHCFVSCLCEIIKADQRVDHRPFYFGVWDAQVLIDAQSRLAYHAPTLNHDFFRSWFQRIYGVAVNSWYRPELSKAQNLHIMQTLLQQKSASEQLMVMLDLYLLPERENKFNQNPFPHYVLLTETDDPNQWFMSDPDFRWQGVQSKAQVIQAVASDAVAGGFIFDSNQIKPAENQVIADYFLACIKRDSNPMTDRVRQVVQRHEAPAAAGPELAQLGAALHHLPVLAIRKYAYEHAFAFFWLDIGFAEPEFEAWCEVIEDLVSSYKKIQYRAMKLSTGQLSRDQQSALFSEIYRLLDQQDATEFRIKTRLYQLFEQWCGIHQLGYAAKAAGSAEVSL
ncbi:MAG: phosphopantetheine-binding protein [Gammaproteobacteria bacterium]|nr:phosphopantetheine-binding protein [Gammaproteobacteria bacterium]MBU1554300.1 phosphopantetheine-binding protein [Gammaproteobacteria bacterium]MBU2070464.1 phosphopantetheine-binding protein [Gammaproteobacteria bacterium]MBU2185265.1 phosphopantetheine-binding protein [Gammaproteobacteria bacterium]MBU2205056.1 phosphopantetheine-binding protein [Gammaproteobacteria bacterium]